MDRVFPADDRFRPGQPTTSGEEVIRNAIVAGAVATVSVLARGPACPADAAPSAATVLFHITDPRIDEASGIAAGIASPGVVYVQNDSGDEARFFALDPHTGRTLAVYRVPGATNVDWEDIAVARDARGVASVWLADIGDNAARRKEIEIYRVDEPHVDRSGPDVAATTSAPQVWRLRYPDGAADAESLAVSPTGTAYVVTKSLTGVSSVYAVPARPDASHVQVVRRIGSIRFGFTGTPGGPNLMGQLSATAAALSRDGTVFAVRTYTDAYLWRVRHADVAAALKTDPVRIALPAQPQGEGLAVDGTRLLIDSEQVGSAVYAVGLPAAVTAPLPAGTSAAGSVGPLPPSLARRSAASDALPVWLVGAGALLLVTVGTGIAHLRRRGRRPR